MSAVFLKRSEGAEHLKDAGVFSPLSGLTHHWAYPSLGLPMTGLTHDWAFHKGAGRFIVWRGRQLPLGDEVTFGEDCSRIRNGESTENMAVLRSMALNLLKRDPSKSSLCQKCFRAAMNNDFLRRLITQF